jgi:hypothetical protein
MSALQWRDRVGFSPNFPFKLPRSNRQHHDINYLIVFKSLPNATFFPLCNFIINKSKPHVNTYYFFVCLSAHVELYCPPNQKMKKSMNQIAHISPSLLNFSYFNL